MCTHRGFSARLHHSPFRLFVAAVALCAEFLSLPVAEATVLPGAIGGTDAEATRPEELMAKPGGESVQGTGAAPAGEPSKLIKERWGVEPSGVRLVADGYLLEFRFRVLDADKAAGLVNAGYSAYLIDQASGAKLLPPAQPRMGRSRPSARVVKPRADRTYYVLFANPGRSIQPGRKVTVVVADLTARDLVVQ